jgi:hypothetical protein
MGKLRPIGSEKLQGVDMINRILEISNYKLNIPKPINEDSSFEYKKTLVDGYAYHIVKEKNGYVIKKGLNESMSEYIEPMKNRKFYPSYSQALKRLNLITKEVNYNQGFEKNISLFESDEDTQYVLKTGGEQTEQAQTPAPPAPAPQPAPPAPAPPAPPAPMSGEEGQMPEPEMEMPEPDMEMDEPEMEMDEPNMDDEEEQVTFKTIQKLTGKLGQKIRTFLSDEENEMSSKDIKYVINSVLSALNLDSLEEEDKEEIIGKFEGGDEGMMGDEEMPMGDEEMPMGDEEMPMGDEEMPMGDEEMPQPEVQETYHNGSMRDRQYEKRMDNMFEDMVSESKIDKLLMKYFQPNVEKNNTNKMLRQIENISETHIQESSARKIVKNYPKIKLLGKNSKNHLVFEINEERISVTPKGNIL